MARAGEQQVARALPQRRHGEAGIVAAVDHHWAAQRRRSPRARSRRRRTRRSSAPVTRTSVAPAGSRRREGAAGPGPQGRGRGSASGWLSAAPVPRRPAAPCPRAIRGRRRRRSRRRRTARARRHGPGPPPCRRRRRPSVSLPAWVSSAAAWATALVPWSNGCDLERAHRAVPQQRLAAGEPLGDRLGASPGRRRGSCRRRSTASTGTVRVAAPALNSFGDHDVGRQHDRHVLGRRPWP